MLTRILEGAGLGVAEVTGSCFCCAFDDMIASVAGLVRGGADVVVGEPVGSCADLSATILQPLKDRFRVAFRTAPLTVLAVDPGSMEAEVLATGPADARFSNVTMALRVADELWIGTFAGDRIAYTRINGVE